MDNKDNIKEQLEFVSIKDIESLCNVSQATIMRWVDTHRDDTNYSYKRGRNRYICKEMFIIDYPPVNKSNNSSPQDKEGEFNKNNNYTEDNKNHEKIALMTISKQANDISQNLLNINNKKIPIIRHTTFWTAIVAIIIIITLVFVGITYKQELISNHKKELTNKDISYKKDLTNQNLYYKKDIIITEKEVNSLKNRLTEKEKYYQAMLANNKKLAGYQSQLITDYKKQILELKTELKELNSDKTSSNTTTTQKI
ncbi:MAG TPA: hypothetical protein QF753_07250 [Victivallales bacterium]|nr:hypothetical protein [Victivallales bacterium]